MLVEPDERWHRILSLLIAAMGWEVVPVAPVVLFGAGLEELRQFKADHPDTRVVAVVDRREDGRAATEAGASAVVTRSQRRLMRDLQHALT